PRAGRLLSPSDPDASPAAGTSDRLNPGSARSILLTLLGEFVLPRGRPAWTATLVHALLGAGIAEKAARQAIARAAATGWIEAHPVGRQTCWSITEHGRGVIDEGAQRVLSMSRRSAPWDGRWLVLVAGVPETSRALKLKTSRALHWIGFGNPLPSLWVNPHPEREDEARRVLQQLGLEKDSYAFVGPSSRMGMTDRQIVDRSWDLGTVSAHYEALLKRFGRLRPGAGDAMLFTHVQLVNEWQRIPFIDPGLPNVLLPPRWGGSEAVARLESLRAQWSDAAQRRWDEVAGVVPTV
ncbi:MAG TPA: PaaX family transcriptional regulator C-terminal domain-containing protein, partial [Ramlibacter sp.]|nr:PaaX family transcriptional regulator C-terminal domain-containing protein [Ramlibacter sp.]